jgi:acyl-CoA thioester hydrolase
MPVTDAFRHRTRVEVRFRDLDAYGHVNNAVTTSYVEHGRITYLRDVLGVDPTRLVPLIMASVTVHYTTPIRFGGEVEIGSRVDWIGRTSLGMAHRLTDVDSSQELATATTVLVAYDYEQARPIPVPEEWRMTLQAYEGHDLQRAQDNA